jgi:hypothetical protein
VNFGENRGEMTGFPPKFPDAQSNRLLAKFPQYPLVLPAGRMLQILVGNSYATL